MSIPATLEQTAPPSLTLLPAPEPLPLPKGLATYAGLAYAVAGLAAALGAALADKTPESVAALASSVLALLGVLGGRYAQAVARFRQTVPIAVTAVQQASAYAEAVLDGLDDPDEGLSLVRVAPSDVAPSDAQARHSVGAATDEDLEGRVSTDG